MTLDTKEKTRELCEMPVYGIVETARFLEEAIRCELWLDAA